MYIYTHTRNCIYFRICVDMERILGGRTATRLFATVIYRYLDHRQLWNTEESSDPIHQKNQSRVHVLAHIWSRGYVKPRLPACSQEGTKLLGTSASTRCSSALSNSCLQ